MSKSILFFMAVALVLTTSIGICEIIDVNIKSMDDGVRTTKQHDYQEAEMNAKLQVIERAGMEISSITKVVNFETRFDMVESRAKAVLLPGFQVVDMGYQTDGEYQVVLSGKVQVGGIKESAGPDLQEAVPASSSGGSSQVTQQDGNYVAYANGIIHDLNTGLEWYVGPNIATSWDQAKAWADSLSIDGGGWRMPTRAELKTLYKNCAGTCNISSLFKDSDHAMVYAEERDVPRALAFSFYAGVWNFVNLPNLRNPVGRAFAVRSRSPAPEASRQETTPSPSSNSSSQMVQQEGTYVAYANGIIHDRNTGLDWYVGPDKEMVWNEAKAWVDSLSIDGGGWRMPTRAELKTLYKEIGIGSRNMSPLFKTTGDSVWSGETPDSSSAWLFYFRNGYEHWGTRDNRCTDYRAFAVRSRK